MPKICLGQDGFVPVGGTYETDNNAILDFAQKEGFQGIELHVLYQPYDLDNAAQIKKEYETKGLEIPGLQTGHVTYYHNPISDDKDDRRKYVEAIDEALKFDEAIGAIHSTLTPPTLTGEFTQERYLRALDTYIETIGEVVALAEKRGIVMAVEPEPPMILNGGKFRDPIEDIQTLLRGVDSKNLRLLFDISHINILSNGDPPGFLRKLHGKVSWVHVADNDMKVTPSVGTATHLEFGKGNVDMEELMRTFKEEVPDLKWLQIDTWENPAPFDTAKKNRAELVRILQKVGWT